MEKPHTLFDILILIAIWIISGTLVLALATCVVTAIYVETHFGPRDDDTLIKIIPEKIEIEEIIAKEADAWNGSCLTFVMKISDKTSHQILKDGQLYFDVSTKISRGAEEDRPIQYEPWTKNSNLTAEQKESISHNFISAIQCSGINEDFVKKAVNATKEINSYFSETRVTKSHDKLWDTQYIISPTQGLLFVARYGS